MFTIYNIYMIIMTIRKTCFDIYVIILLDTCLREANKKFIARNNYFLNINYFECFIEISIYFSIL